MSRRQKIFQSVGMALIMSLCMSFVMTAKNVGFHSHFILVWMSNALIGFAVALPLSFLVPPVIQKLTHIFGIK